MSILETIEAFNVVRNAYKVARLSNFVENVIALAYGSCNFENFQNITRAHKSRNAPAGSYDFFYLFSSFKFQVSSSKF